MVMNLMQQYRNIPEQDLLEDLIEESIEQRGIEVHYIVRDKINPDYLLGESSMSDFTEFYIMPMFLESVEHFNGNGDVYDALGMAYNDSSIFQVGAKKFKTTLDDKDIPMPREGDLIYLPFSNSLWEISKVKKDLRYYQLGKNYSYRLICKLFEYSYEKLESNFEGDFNDLSEEVSVDDEGLKRVLGLSPEDTRDESGIIKEELKEFKSFDPNDPFSF